LPFVLHEGFRGRARQVAGKTGGKSKAGWLQSHHNFGLATDYAGHPDLSPPHPDTGKPWPWHPALPWADYGCAVEDAGLSWSGRWTGNFRELVHGDMSDEFKRPNLVLGELATLIDASSRAWLRWWLSLPEMKGTHTLVACAQRLALFLGADPGPIDGWWGRRTAAAFEALTGVPQLDVDALLDLCAAA